MTPKGKTDLDDNDNVRLVTPAEEKVLEEDEDDAEWANLRCTSLQSEEVANREKEKKERRQGRQNRCPDYPGLAFGSAMFGSDTMMKFNIIKNELHNIMKSQLRRVDGEVSAFSQRIRDLDSGLERSEYFIKTATTALMEASQYELENRKEGDEEEDALSQFDAQVRLLEGKMVEARRLAAKAKDGL